MSLLCKLHHKGMQCHVIELLHEEKWMVKVRESGKPSRYSNVPSIMFSIWSEGLSFYVQFDYPQRVILAIKIIKLLLQDGQVKHHVFSYSC